MSKQNIYDNDAFFVYLFQVPEDARTINGF